MSEQLATTKYQNTKTGTIYKRVWFSDIAPYLVKVETEAGSVYLVRRQALKRLPTASEAPHE